MLLKSAIEWFEGLPNLDIILISLVSSNLGGVFHIFLIKIFKLIKTKLLYSLNYSNLSKYQTYNNKKSLKSSLASQVVINYYSTIIRIIVICTSRFEITLHFIFLQIWWWLLWLLGRRSQVPGSEFSALWGSKSSHGAQERTRWMAGCRTWRFVHLIYSFIF